MGEMFAEDFGLDPILLTPSSLLKMCKRKRTHSAPEQKATVIDSCVLNAGELKERMGA